MAIKGGVGYTQLAAAQAAAAADATSKANAAQAAAIAAGLGVGQTWQAVTRSHTVTYTNSTGKPIVLRISSNNGGAACSVVLTVGGVALPTITGTTSALPLMSETIIPAGSTYMINIGAGSVTCEELR